MLAHIYAMLPGLCFSHSGATQTAVVRKLSAAFALGAKEKFCTQSRAINKNDKKFSKKSCLHLNATLKQWLLEGWWGGGCILTNSFWFLFLMLLSVIKFSCACPAHLWGVWSTDGPDEFCGPARYNDSWLCSDPMKATPYALMWLSCTFGPRQHSI